MAKGEYIEITCESDNCEKEFEVEYEYDSGEKASWGYSGGNPEIPPSFNLVEDVILCPHCNYDNTRNAKQALADHDFSNEPPEPEPYDDY